MIRKALIKSKKGPGKGKIAWRSHEPARIEGFSDAVFGFSVSLLVFSLEVPKNSHDLLNGLQAFIPFVFCFVGVFLIWNGQYRFFRHFGLKDNMTMALNAALLMIVLFYVYPLKFMFAMIMLKEYILEPHDLLPLLYVYVGGYMSIYILFSLMYLNAFKRRHELDLTPIEEFETRSYIFDNLALVLVGALVIVSGVVINHFAPDATFACFAAFAATWPVTGLIGRHRAKLFRKKFGNIAPKEMVTEDR